MRLLLAEDEKEFSKALTAILKHNGYSVDAVYNGKDVLDYLLGGDYDCAILDIMMPLLDGISVLKGIRHEGLDLPVIMLTAKSEIDDRVFGLDSGIGLSIAKAVATAHKAKIHAKKPRWQFVRNNGCILIYTLKSNIKWNTSNVKMYVFHFCFLR